MVIYFLCEKHLFSLLKLFICDTSANSTFMKLMMHIYAHIYMYILRDLFVKIIKLVII